MLFNHSLLHCSDQRNILEAAFVGTSQAIPLVLNIGANLIAFLSLLAAVNGFLGWFGGLLDFPQLSFEVISSCLVSASTKSLLFLIKFDLCSVSQPRVHGLNEVRGRAWMSPPNLSVR